ncbi:MAG: hypothetical protein LBT05_09770, partial [Planctomycetaceae bacterium]|nr:hypothetical protein [Planctomycetaceae bacterium]
IFIAAKTDTQGRFTVLAQDLPVGRYAVYLGPDKPEIPKQYQSPLESPLVVNIQAGTNELTLDLK